MPTSPAAPAEGGTSGFTLVELLVVLVLLATTALLVLPRFAALAPAPQAARRLELAQALEILRLRAIFEHRPLAVDPMALLGEDLGLRWLPASGEGTVLLFSPDGRSSGGWLEFPDGSRIRIDRQQGIRIDG